MPTAIKMIDLESLHQQMQPELETAIGQVIGRSDFIDGQAVGAFLAQLQAYTGAAHVLGCGNGTDALQLALMALELPAGAEVILPAFSYVSAAEAVALLGYTPVFADVCPDTFNLDPQSVASRITARTAAIIPVHLFGHCAPLGPLEQLAQQHGLYLIEDNAQSLGATVTGENGRPAFGGTVGQVGITSFFPTKMLGGMGDGGAIFTRDADLARRLGQLARHGQEKKYEFTRVGINSRLDTIQAAVLAVKLRYFDAHLQARQQAAEWYRQALSGLAGLALPATRPGYTHVYNQYVVRVAPAQRDALRQYLAGQGIPSAVYYPAPLHLQLAYRHLGAGPGSLPVAEQLCASVLALPMHALLTQAQVSYIGEQVRAFFQRGPVAGK